MNKMKNAFTKAKNSVSDSCDKLFVKASTVAHCTRGELAANTIGAIIVAVVIIGLLIVAVNKFFPTFFTEMLTSMKTKLNAGWDAGWTTVTP